MPTWNADQYLRFNDERTRPCRELAARISVVFPRRVIDLGCGPGNSTKVLAEKWPDAELVGLDSSPEMIGAASQTEPVGDWRVCDIAAWANEAGEKFDVVFSNAALQWVEDHLEVFPKLMQRVSAAGAFAVQMPGNFDGHAHRIMRELAASSEWRGYFPSGSIREWHAHDLPFYYDILAPVAATVDLWETEYVHVMSDAAGIVEWYKGTGLRPFLDALPSDVLRTEFCDEYLVQIRKAYPTRSDGRVLFPFRRLFLIAYQLDSK